MQSHQLAVFTASVIQLECLDTAHIYSIHRHENRYYQEQELYGLAVNDPLD